MDSEDPVREEHPATRRARAARSPPSPSPAPRRARSRRYITLPIRESPQHSTGSLDVGEVRLQPRQRPLDHRASGRCPGRRTRTRPERARGGARATARVPSHGGSRKANVEAASGIAWSVGQHLRRGGVLDPALLLRGAVEEPVVAEGVGQHVLRYDAVDPVHQEERRAEHRSPVGSIQRTAGDQARRCRLADQPHGVVLVLEVVGREDREVRTSTAPTRAT